MLILHFLFFCLGLPLNCYNPRVKRAKTKSPRPAGKRADPPSSGKVACEILARKRGKSRTPRENLGHSFALNTPKHKIRHSPPPNTLHIVSLQTSPFGFHSVPNLPNRTIVHPRFVVVLPLKTTQGKFEHSSALKTPPGENLA